MDDDGMISKVANPSIGREPNQETRFSPQLSLLAAMYICVMHVCGEGLSVKPIFGAPKKNQQQQQEAIWQIRWNPRYIYVLY